MAVEQAQLQADPDPLADPRTAAEQLLAEADPLPRLDAWLRTLPAPELARILHAMKDALQENARQETALGETVHPLFRWAPVDLALGDRAVHLDLLLLPTIFAPDDEWSVAFLEGLLRKPLRDYRGKRLIELGTGSGWVSLALLKLTELESVLGVDLNPQAVLISRLNAVLNGHDAEGRPLPDRCAARFTSAVSDLLTEPRRTGHRADLIVGCIPQVVAPSQDLDSDQGLYDLSNYAVAQGVVEDQFGLGLNARALQESLHLLEPGGSVVLNLAGRPGADVVRRMFRRRGFQPETLWRTRVRQAADTDIAPLVELEERTGSPFAFQLHRHSPQSIPARVALEALAARLPIYHELQVVEGRPRSEALFPLAATLSRLGLDELWENLDLSADEDVLDEQLRFVTALAESFGTDARAPYPHEAGNLSLRTRITDFCRKFHSLPLTPSEAFTAPNRAELLHAVLLCLAAPGERVVLSGSLRAALEPATRKAGVEAVWVHEDTTEIAELLPHLRPRVVLLAGVTEGLDQLLRRCRELDALLLLDESERLQIGPDVPEVPGLRLLAENPGSGHLAVLAGLARSRAFPDVELALLFTRHRRLIHGLELAAELTWSRISHFHQAFYESLFDELLSFQVNAPTARPLPEAGPGPALTPTVEALLRTPAFARPAPGADVIRLDYGENETTLPRTLQVSILQGFLAHTGRTAADDPVHDVEAVTGYLRATRLPELTPSQVMLGPGTLPLLFDALRALRARLGRAPLVLLPQGSYGLFAPLVEAAGGTVRMLPAEAPGFLATPKAVTDAGPFDVLLLTSPANPGGAAYTPAELRRLVSITSANGGKLILDEVFGLLAQLDGPLPLGADRWSGLDQAGRQCLLVLGGLSKEFAAGGLRLGFAAGADTGWIEALRALQLAPLPAHLRIAVQRLFADRPTLWPELERLRTRLRNRRAKLADGLRELGFGLPAGDTGGLFLHPDLSPLTDDPERFVLDLEEHARVRLNTPSWSGATTHARACFALSEGQLDEALARLRDYLGSAERARGELA